MKLSNFFTLSVRDFVKGFLVAVLGAALTVLQTSIEAGSFKFDWTSVWHVSLAAGVAYLIKNLFTNSKDEFLAKERK